MQQYRTVRSLQEDLDFLGLGEKKKNTNPVIAALTEDIGQHNSLTSSLNPINEATMSPQGGMVTPMNSAQGKYETKVFKSDKEANDFIKSNKEWNIVGNEGKEGTPEYKVHVVKNGQQKTEDKEPSIEINSALIKKYNVKPIDDRHADLIHSMVEAYKEYDDEMVLDIKKKIDDYLAGKSKEVKESIDLDEAIKVQKMHRHSASERAVARKDYRAKRSKIKRAVKKLHKKSAWKKKHKKFIKTKHGRKAGTRKRFIMAGIDSIATMAETLNRNFINLQEQTLSNQELVSIFESIGGICDKFNNKISNLFEAKYSLYEFYFGGDLGTYEAESELEAYHKMLEKHGYSENNLPKGFDWDEVHHSVAVQSKKDKLKEESPEEKKLGYDMSYVGKEWDELDDFEDDDNKDLDNDFDFTEIGDEWDDLDDHDEEGNEVEDDYEDENDKDYVGAEESVMMDMRAMQQDAAEVSKKLQEGTITTANAKDIFISMVNHIVESAKILVNAIDEEFNYVGQDKIDSEDGKPEKPDSNVGKYVGKGGEPKEQEGKPEKADSNEYVGKDAPKAEKQKPVAPDSNAGKYVDSKGEPEAVKQSPAKVDGNAGKYVDSKGEPDEENEKLDLEISTKGKHVGDEPFGKLIDKTVPVIEAKGKTLRTVKVTFSDGSDLTTNVAAGLSDEQIKNYYKIGKEFNMGNINDRMVKVTKVEILPDLDLDEAKGTNILSKIYGRFPVDSKRKIGDKFKVMLTGNTADVLGKKQYDMVILQDLSQDEIDKLAKLFKLEEAKEPIDLLSKAKEYVQNGGAYNASIKDFKEWLAINPNATWKMCKEFLDESHSEESMDTDHDTDSLSRQYGEAKETLYNWLDINNVSRNMGFNPRVINDIKNILFPIGGEQKSPSIKDIESALKQIKLSDVGIKTFLSKLSSKEVKESDNKYVGQDKPNAEKDSPEKPESNKGKYVDPQGEPDEEDEKLDADSMKGKHVGEKQGKIPSEVPVIESEELNEAKPNIEALRKVASAWHGGQFTAMYAFASSGGINPGLAKEALESAKEAETHPDLKPSERKRDAKALRMIADLAKQEVKESADYGSSKFSSKFDSEKFIQLKKERDELNKKVIEINSKRNGLPPEKGDKDYDEYEKMRREMRRIQDHLASIQHDRGYYESKDLSLNTINEEVERIMGRK